MRTAGAPPGPEGYQVTSLIKSIESRLRESATGDSQRVVRPRSDENVSEAATALDFSREDAVDRNTEVIDKEQSNTGSELRGHIGRNESDSIASLPKLNISLSHTKPEHDETVSKSNRDDESTSIDKQTEDILVVLSVDDERHQQLKDTALLWQVRSLHALLLHIIACIECSYESHSSQRAPQPWCQTLSCCMCSMHAWESQAAVSGHTLDTSEICY